MRMKISILLGLLISSILLAACGSSGTFTLDDIAYASPGATVKYAIVMGLCIKGYWQSTDVKLTLYAPNGSVFYEGHTSRAKEWNKYLDPKARQDSAFAHFEVAVPKDDTIGKVYSGKLTGTVICPVNYSNGDSFTDQTFNKDKDVELHVSAASDVRSMAANSFWEIVGGLAVVAAIFSVIFVIGKAIGGLKPKYRL
jgi:hypothetical protein